MYDFAVIWDWISFSVRWLHVITAMAWIGASFFFIALDLGLRPVPDMPKGCYGEEWHVHGGGFYHIQKYLVAPEDLPAHLVWHKWQSYMTWVSGAALLMIVYWVGGELYLLDPTKADLTLWQGIFISAGSLAIGWFAYDQLCKSRLGESPTALMLILFGILVVMSWGYVQVFTGRAALLHLGAFTATIMTGNVFFQIMPNQRIVVADLQAGRTPDARYGKIAKLRSTHNNYLTLPVIFFMLSNHYPLAFGTQFNWVIAALVFLNLLRLCRTTQRFGIDACARNHLLDFLDFTAGCRANTCNHRVVVGLQILDLRFQELDTIKDHVVLSICLRSARRGSCCWACTCRKLLNDFLGCFRRFCTFSALSELHQILLKKCKLGFHFGIFLFKAGKFLLFLVNDLLCGHVGAAEITAKPYKA